MELGTGVSARGRLRRSLMKHVVPWMLLTAVIGCQGSEPDDRPAEMSSSPAESP